MPDLDVAELARSLEKATNNLDRHIATEAQKRANKLAVEYAKAADERIRDNAVGMQRLQDLVASRVSGFICRRSSATRSCSR